VTVRRVVVGTGVLEHRKPPLAQQLRPVAGIWMRGQQCRWLAALPLDFSATASLPLAG
jgi:hypothetical protein